MHFELSRITSPRSACSAFSSDTDDTQPDSFSSLPVRSPRAAFFPRITRQDLLSIQSDAGEFGRLAVAPALVRPNTIPQTIKSDTSEFDRLVLASAPYDPSIYSFLSDFYEELRGIPYEEPIYRLYVVSSSLRELLDIEASNDYRGAYVFVEKGNQLYFFDASKKKQRISLGNNENVRRFRAYVDEQKEEASFSQPTVLFLGRTAIDTLFLSSGCHQPLKIELLPFYMSLAFEAAKRGDLQTLESLLESAQLVRSYEALSIDLLMQRLCWQGQKIWVEALIAWLTKCVSTNPLLSYEAFKTQLDQIKSEAQKRVEANATAEIEKENATAQPILKKLFSEIVESLLSSDLFFLTPEDFSVDCLTQARQALKAQTLTLSVYHAQAANQRTSWLTDLFLSLVGEGEEGYANYQRRLFHHFVVHITDVKYAFHLASQSALKPLQELICVRESASKDEVASYAVNLPLDLTNETGQTLLEVAFEARQEGIVLFLLSRCNPEQFQVFYAHIHARRASQASLSEKTLASIEKLKRIADALVEDQTFLYEYIKQSQVFYTLSRIWNLHRVWLFEALEKNDLATPMMLLSRQELKSTLARTVSEETLEREQTEWLKENDWLERNMSFLQEFIADCHQRLAIIQSEEKQNQQPIYLMSTLPSQYQKKFGGAYLLILDRQPPELYYAREDQETFEALSLQDIEPLCQFFYTTYPELNRLLPGQEKIILRTLNKEQTRELISDELFSSLLPSGEIFAVPHITFDPNRSFAPAELADELKKVLAALVPYLAQEAMVDLIQADELLNAPQYTFCEDFLSAQPHLGKMPASLCEGILSVQPHLGKMPASFQEMLVLCNTMVQDYPVSHVDSVNSLVEYMLLLQRKKQLTVGRLDANPCHDLPYPYDIYARSTPNQLVSKMMLLGYKAWFDPDINISELAESERLEAFFKALAKQYFVQLPLNVLNLEGSNALDVAYRFGSLPIIAKLYAWGLRPHITALPIYSPFMRDLTNERKLERLATLVEYYQAQDMHSPVPWSAPPLVSSDSPFLKAVEDQLDVFEKVLCEQNKKQLQQLDSALFNFYQQSLYQLKQKLRETQELSHDEALAGFVEKNLARAIEKHQDILKNKKGQEKPEIRQAKEAFEKFTKALQDLVRRFHRESKFGRHDSPQAIDQRRHGLLRRVNAVLSRAKEIAVIQIEATEEEQNEEQQKQREQHQQEEKKYHEEKKSHQTHEETTYEADEAQGSASQTQALLVGPAEEIQVIDQQVVLVSRTFGQTEQGFGPRDAELYQAREEIDRLKQQRERDQKAFADMQRQYEADRQLLNTLVGFLPPEFLASLVAQNRLAAPSAAPGSAIFTGIPPSLSSDGEASDSNARDAEAPGNSSDADTTPRSPSPPAGPA